MNDETQLSMYHDAIPKQYEMLSRPGCLILPLFMQKKSLLEPKNLSALNGFASIWCCIENIFLAATAEELAYAMRIPSESELEHITSVLALPENYIMPCYISIGHPSPDAAVIKQKEFAPVEKIHWDKW